MARVNEIAIQIVISGSKIVVGFERMLRLAAFPPNILKAQRSHSRVGIVVMNGRILDLQIRNADTCRQTQAWIESKRNGRIEGVAVPVNGVLVCSNSRRIPLFAISRVAQGKT